MIRARRQGLSQGPAPSSRAYPGGPLLTFADLPGRGVVASATHPGVPKSGTFCCWLVRGPFDTAPDPPNSYLLNKCLAPLVPMVPLSSHLTNEPQARPLLSCPPPQTPSCLSIPLQSPAPPATCGAISPVPCTEPTPSRGPDFSCMRLVWRFLGLLPGRLCPRLGIVGRGDQVIWWHWFVCLLLSRCCAVEGH